MRVKVAFLTLRHGVIVREIKAEEYIGSQISRLKEVPVDIKELRRIVRLIDSYVLSNTWHVDYEHFSKVKETILDMIKEMETELLEFTNEEV